MQSQPASFTAAIVVCAERSKVFAQLAEPALMVGLQPLLVQCEILSRDAGPDNRTRSYEAVFTEFFRLVGPLGYRNRIRSSMKADPEAYRIEFTVRSFPRIKLASRYQLVEKLSQTEVELAVSIDCAKILRPLVVPTALKAHLRLLENLKRRCETLGDGSR
jgi:hypothetical protein